jgi:methylmalonyl-CoA mutase cobalamin-binding subunit
MRDVMEGRRLSIASTDVHEFAIGIIHQLLSEAGAEIINLGAEKNPDEVVFEAHSRQVEAILLSTHNGMALEYAKNLRQELVKQKINIPVLMGGVLNQKLEDRALPVDVSDDLKALGFQACKQLEGGLHKMLEMKKQDHQED